MKIRWILAACILLFASNALAFDFTTPLDRAGMNPSSMRSLMKKGELLIIEEKPNGELEMVTAGIIIDAPVSEVYKTLVDFDKYHEFMPSTLSVKVVDDQGKTKDVQYHIQFKFSVLSFSAEYTLTQTFKKNKEIRWNLKHSKDGKLKATYGAWQLYTSPDGKTIAFYSTYSDMKSISWVVKKAFDAEPSMEISVNASSCVMILKALKNRLEKPGYKPNLKSK
jgi:uncharacterized membrane protein